MRLLLTLLILFSTPALADQQNFRVKIAGFNAGILSIADTSNTKRYKVAAKIESRGIAAFFGSTAYSGSAEGRILNGRLFPTRYDGRIQSGETSTIVTLAYRQGVPRVERYQPTPPATAFTIPFETQRGTVDILTSAYWVFRERPLSELCDTTYFGFDGRRRTAISLRPAVASGDMVTCEGTYTRVAGFSDRALRRGQVFPLTLRYRAIDAKYQLQEIKAQTVFGSAKVTRMQ
ncbi:MAG: DUF3108 domain-containing protein [Pseudomonadota bacterium]